MQETVIFDLDGTLALIDHRRHLVTPTTITCPQCKGTAGVKLGEPCLCNGSGTVQQKPPASSWRMFYAMCDKDAPNQWVIDLAKQYYQNDHRVIIFSGRSEEVRGKTLQWLSDHGVNYDLLVMRPVGNTTPDDELKAQWLEEYSLTPDNVVAVFDDRTKMVRMWRKRGFNCAQVADGNF